MSLNEVFVFLGCLLPASICAYTDVRERLIYNKVTFPMLILGLAYAAYASRLPDALLGIAVGFGIIAICVVMGGAGGGDAKLAAALGAWFGCWNVLFLLFVGSILGVIWGCVNLYKKGKLRSRMALFFTGLYLNFVCGIRGTLQLPQIPDNPDESFLKETIPFGAFLTVAAWLAFIIISLQA